MWTKNYNKGKFENKTKEEPTEDMSSVRNLHEKLASIKLGNAFALTTREGLRIFKLVEIRALEKK